MKIPILLVAIVLAVAVFGVAQEEVYLRVTTPGVQRVVIAIPDMPLLAGGERTVAARFLETLRDDLRQSAVMTVLADEAARLVEVDPKDARLTRTR